jgi:hypothetical protein
MAAWRAMAQYYGHGHDHNWGWSDAANFIWKTYAQRARSQCGQPAAAATVLSYDQVPASQVLRPRLVCSCVWQRAPWTGGVRPDVDRGQCAGVVFWILILDYLFIAEISVKYHICFCYHGFRYGEIYFRHNIHRATELRPIDCWPHRLAALLVVVAAAKTSSWSWSWP